MSLDETLQRKTGVRHSAGGGCRRRAGPGQGPVCDRGLAGPIANRTRVWGAAALPCCSIGGTRVDSPGADVGSRVWAQQAMLEACWLSDQITLSASVSTSFKGNLEMSVNQVQSLDVLLRHGQGKQWDQGCAESSVLHQKTHHVSHLRFLHLSSVLIQRRCNK